MNTSLLKRAVRTAATATLALAALTVGVLTGLTTLPAAAASPGQSVDMNAQCAAQYPGGADFLPAEAYLVAPRDAYSWRCKRTSTSPNGGTVTDLAVDPNGYCPTGRATPSATNPPSWECA